MEETKSWYKKIMRRKNFSQGKPASIQSIRKAESELGVLFPEEYKLFLRRFGYAGWMGHAINGIIEGSTEEFAEFFDVVANTQFERSKDLPDSFQPFPENSIVLETFDFGGLFVLRCGEPSCFGNVVLITHESEYNVVDSWKAFDEFGELVLTK